MERAEDVVVSSQGSDFSHKGVSLEKIRDYGQCIDENLGEGWIVMRM